MTLAFSSALARGHPTRRYGGLPATFPLEQGTDISSYRPSKDSDPRAEDYGLPVLASGPER
jgi:hypothetical protein